MQPLPFDNKFDKEDAGLQLSNGAVLPPHIGQLCTWQCLLHQWRALRAAAGAPQQPRTERLGEITAVARLARAPTHKAHEIKQSCCTVTLGGQHTVQGGDARWALQEWCPRGQGLMIGCILIARTALAGQRLTVLHQWVHAGCQDCVLAPGTDGFFTLVAPDCVSSRD